MTSAVSPTRSALDNVLGSVKLAHQLYGCRTCGIMALFAPVAPGKRTA